MVAGGAGNDQLYGFGGADSFLFNTALSATTNVDRIVDFNVAADTIRLENAVFTRLAAAGVLSADLFWVVGTPRGANPANDYIVHDRAAGTLSYDVDGSGAAAAVLFARVAAGLVLTNADFSWCSEGLRHRRSRPRDDERRFRGRVRRGSRRHPLTTRHRSVSP